MAIITMGYQPNIASLFPSGVMSALDQGRRLATQDWSKYANLEWRGSTSPRIYIGVTNRSDIWAITYANGKILVTNNNKVWKNRWFDIDIWENLFMHEIGHVLLGQYHCSNPVPGTNGNCVLSITGHRELIPCPSCMAKLQTKYGKPIVSNTLIVNGVSNTDLFEIDLLKREYILNGVTHPISSVIKNIIFNDRGGSSSIRNCNSFIGDSTSVALSSLFNLSLVNAKNINVYGISGSAAKLIITGDNNRLKITTDYSLIENNTTRIRCKLFKTICGQFTNTTNSVVRIKSQDVKIGGNISITGTINNNKIEWLIQ